MDFCGSVQLSFWGASGVQSFPGISVQILSSYDRNLTTPYQTALEQKLPSLMLKDSDVSAQDILDSIS